MKPNYKKTLGLLVLFIACMVGVIISFLCIAIFFEALVWMLTGAFNLAMTDLVKTTKIGCVIGAFTGVVFVIARQFKLKGF